MDVNSTKKEFAPLRSKFFPSRVDPISDKLYCFGKQTGCHKSFPHSVNMAENHGDVAILLNDWYTAQPVLRKHLRDNKNALA